MSEELERPYRKLLITCLWDYFSGFVYFAVVYVLFQKRMLAIPQTPAHPMSAFVLCIFAILIVFIVTLSKNRLLFSPPALSDMKIGKRQMKALGLENADSQEAKAFGWFARRSVVLLAIADSPMFVAVLLVFLAARPRTYFCPFGEKTLLYACILFVFAQLLMLTVFPTKQRFIQFYRAVTEAG